MSSIIDLIIGAGYTIGPALMGAILGRTGFEFSWRFAAAVVLISTFAMKLIDWSTSLKGKKQIPL